MLFKILYILFFVTSLFYGNLYIGPVTPRQIMAIVMLVMCIKEKTIKFDEYFRPYMFFVLLFVIGGLFTGYIGETARFVLGYFFVAYVAYQSTKVLILKYNSEKLLLYLILAVIGVDAIVSIAQMLQMPISYSILDTLHINVSELDEISEKADRRGLDILYGISVPGLVGPVSNGYVLSVACALALYNREARIKLYNIAMLLLLLIAVFCTQERTAMIAALLVCAFMFYKVMQGGTVSVSYKLAFFFLVAVFLIFVAPRVFQMIMLGESRFATRGYDLSEDRGYIWSRAMEYILSTPIGSRYEYYDMYKKMPHNVILNAFIFGGWIGGFLIVRILFKQAKLMLKVVLQRIVEHQYLLFVFVCAYAIFTLNSLTHNLSIVSGDSTCWILWGAIVALTNKPIEA